MLKLRGLNIRLRLLLSRLVSWVLKGTSFRAKRLRANALLDLVERKRRAIDILTGGVLGGRAVCLGGVWNWFTDHEGKFPQVDLVFPDVPLTVFILGPLSATWTEARDYGYSRKEWEAEKDRVILIENFVSDVHRPMPAMIIRWEDPITSSSLDRRISLLTDNNYKAAII